MDRKFRITLLTHMLSLPHRRSAGAWRSRRQEASRGVTVPVCAQRPHWQEKLVALTALHGATETQCTSSVVSEIPKLHFWKGNGINHFYARVTVI